MHINPHALHTDQHREHFHKTRDPFILKDGLALDRTAAANKRTLYAFMRTTLDFAVSGLVFTHFFGYTWIMVTGWIFLMIAVALGSYGVIRYYHVKQHYVRLNDRYHLQNEQQETIND